MNEEFDYGWLRMAVIFTVLFCILAFFDMILKRGWFETIMAGLVALWIISIFWTVIFNFKFFKTKSLGG